MCKVTPFSTNTSEQTLASLKNPVHFLILHAALQTVDAPRAAQIHPAQSGPKAKEGRMALTSGDFSAQPEERVLAQA